MRRRLSHSALIAVVALLVACTGDAEANRDATTDTAAGATVASRDEGDRDDDSDWDEFAVEPLPAPTTPEVPEPSPRVTCPDATVEVASAPDLLAALEGATSGDVIGLAPGRYDGNFVATTVATPDAPIFVCGPADAVLAGEGPTESGYTLHLDGAASWRLVGFTVRDGRKGVMVDGGVGNVIQDLTVTHIGDEAIHLRTFSTDNLVLDNTISDTGRRREKFGEGLYVGTAQSNWCELTDCEPDRSDRNRLEGNTITATTSEAVDIKEGTVDGVLLDNTFDGAAMVESDSWVDVKGNGWIVAHNTGTAAPEHGIQTHEIIAGWGSGNAFVANTLAIDADGFGFDMHGPDDANLVSCDNDVTGAASGLANEDCG